MGEPAHASPSTEACQGHPGAPESSVDWFAWLITVHCVALGLMHLGLFDGLFNDAAHRAGAGTDFRVYHGAAQAWLGGESVYAESSAFGYRYHPLFAVAIGVTLGALPIGWAFFVWVVLSEVALLSLLPGIRRRFDPGWRRDVATGLLLGFSPYFLDSYMGQCSFLAGALLWHGVQAMTAGRRWWCGGWFVVAVIIKPLGLALVPILLVRREWRVLTVGLGIVTGLAALYFATDPAGWEAFLRRNLSAPAQAGWTVHAGNQGLHGLVATLLARLHGSDLATLSGYDALPVFARVVLLALPIGVTAASAWLTWRWRDAPGACLALWSLTFALGYKDVWEHSYAFLLPGLILLFHADRIPRLAWGVGALGLALPTGFVFYDVPLPPGPHDPERHWSLATSLVHHLTKPLWAGILYVTMLGSGLGPGRGTFSSETTGEKA